MRKLMFIFSISFQEHNLHFFCSNRVQCDWNKSAEYADILRRQCRWSPGAYTYQYATFLYMIMHEENRPELLSEVEQHLK